LIYLNVRDHRLTSGFCSAARATRASIICRQETKAFGNDNVNWWLFMYSWMLRLWPLLRPFTTHRASGLLFNGKLWFRCNRNKEIYDTSV